jgi:hypothetical protein
MNIFRSKPTTESRTEESEGGFFAKAKGSIVGSRRALGDITNSVAGQSGPQGNDVSKKFMSWFQGPSSASAYTAATAPATVFNVPAAPVVSASDPREYMQRQADDIDARDSENPLFCPEYVNDMYDIFRQTERQFQVNANYMSNQPHVNEKMRTILVDWLVIATIIAYTVDQLFFLQN